MRALAYRVRRQTIANLFLDLRSALAAPLLSSTKVPKRQAHAIIAVWMAIISNHAENRTSTAHEIGKRIGVSRNTINRRLATLQRLGFVNFEGSVCYIADAYASHPPLTPAQLADTEEIIHRASKALLRATNGKKRNNPHGVPDDDDRPQSSRNGHARNSRT